MTDNVRALPSSDYADTCSRDVKFVTFGGDE